MYVQQGASYSWPVSQLVALNQHHPGGGRWSCERRHDYLLSGRCGRNHATSTATTLTNDEDLRTHRVDEGRMVTHTNAQTGDGVRC